MSVNLNDLGIICALGANKAQVMSGLQQADTSPSPLTLDTQLGFAELDVYVGKVSAALPPLTQLQAQYQSRNNQLALAAYQQIEPCYLQLAANVEPSRIAVIIGTSTSGISEGEIARKVHGETASWPENFHYRLQEMASPADYLAQLCGAKGPVYSISTACSSSGKALASGRNLIESGLVDLVICGGVDSLCQLTVNGFKALESTSRGICTPFLAQRDGINIGEGAALFVMSKQAGAIALKGTGESSDAHHISAPDPQGAGAISAMNAALSQAALQPEQLDYINLHGTATPKNDEMESTAVYQVVKDKVSASSTKHLTGHTLGAAGAIEAGICWLLLSDFNQHNMVPLNSSVTARDESLAKIGLVQQPLHKPLHNCLSNSFAFGGNNISLILGINT